MSDMSTMWGSMQNTMGTHLPQVLGRKASRALKRGTPLDWTMVS